MSSNQVEPRDRRDDLVSSFDALALSGGQRDPNKPPLTPPSRRPVPNRGGGFVGGFAPTSVPAYDAADRRRAEWPGFAGVPSPGSSFMQPPVIPMPVPDGQAQSLTMQYAQRLPPNMDMLSPPQPSAPARPQSTSVIPPIANGISSPSLDVSNPMLSSSATPQRPSRPRAASSPPSPTTPSKGNTVQCSGFTKAGPRCSRQIKITSGLPLSASHPDVEIERFCHQHAKELLNVKGFYSHKISDYYVDFADWIPDYLESDTQLALRVEMEKPRSQADVSGYIYTFEIRDPNTPNKVHLKVGRAVNLVKRIDQWGKQCGSKEQILRGWWPGIVEEEDGPIDATVNASLMKGRVKAGEKGPLVHRLERLVHLELADLAMNAPYLQPEFLKTKTDANGNAPPVTPTKKPPSTTSAMRRLQDKPCPDCGTLHKEIFSMNRVEKGRYKGKEWELIVKPVIEKWGAFVSTYV